MRQITLKEMRVERFKSFVRPTTIGFTAAAGLKLISGENKAEPTLGANGAGKSSIWDAVCFCLYGNSVRGLRTADLVSTNHKSTSVELLFQVDDDELVIHRSGPPSRLSINGQPAEQIDVERALGLSRDRFLNSVLFGQAVPLFVDLSIPARGDLLDEVLDLALWMRAAERATKAHTAAERELNEARTRIARAEGEVTGLPDLDDLEERRVTWEGQLHEHIEGKLADMAAREAELAELETKHKALAEQPVPDVDALWKEYQATKKRGDDYRRDFAVECERLRQIDQAILFLEENSTCPVCKQEIAIDFAEEHLRVETARKEKLIAETETLRVNAQTVSTQAEALHTTWRKATAANSELDKNIRVLDALISAKQSEIDTLFDEIERQGSVENPYKSQIEEVTSQHATLSARLEELGTEETKLVSRIQTCDFWRQAFRRVRLFCVKRVLTQLQVETMNAAQALGLLGWQISYTTETETKSGTLKTGVQIEVESTTMAAKFDAWSGGEGQRVRLCIALGLASLIQRWAGVSFRWEVWDEPSAWLSSEGIENLLECLQARAETLNKSVYVCDHRALIFAGFTEVLSVVKTIEGSIVEKLR